jgi:hypothetical protein
VEILEAVFVPYVIQPETGILLVVPVLPAMSSTVTVLVVMMFPKNNPLVFNVSQAVFNSTHLVDAAAIYYAYVIPLLVNVRVVAVEALVFSRMVRRATVSASLVSSETSFVYFISLGTPQGYLRHSLFNLSVKQVPVSKFWLRPCDRSAL